MRRRVRRALLAAIAAVAAILLATFLANLHLVRGRERPRDLDRLAAWLARHPADWLAASAISDLALDAPLPRRMELWRASHQLARHLAPLRPNTAAGFVRAGLFHWYELGPADRAAVLATAEPLMRDPKLFAALYAPLWQLTRDLTWLRRTAPDTIQALEALRDLAVRYGRFDDYRELRRALRQKRLATLEARRGAASPAELMALLPPRLDAADEPLVRAVLQELDRRAAGIQQLGGRVEDVATWAIEHDVEPLGGLAPLVSTPGRLRDVTRARLALALGDDAMASRIEITTAITGSPEWVPYHLDRALFEARRGDAAAADAQLTRAAASDLTEPVVATAAEVAAILGNTDAAARMRTQLAAGARQPRKWSGLCGRDELCASAVTRQYVPAGGAIRIETAVAQSDEIPPYVEIYVDGARAAEGDVRDERTFVLDAAEGLHEIEVRLVNRVTRNGVQRRVRLS